MESNVWSIDSSDSFGIVIRFLSLSSKPGPQSLHEYNISISMLNQVISTMHQCLNNYILLVLMSLSVQYWILGPFKWHKIAKKGNLEVFFLISIDS